MSDGIPKAEFHDERIDMAYWYPKVRDLDVPTPESQPLPLDKNVDGAPEYDTELACEIVENLGGEAFARSGYKSAAHSLNEGSHVQDYTTETVEKTLSELLFQHAMMQMPLGKSLWLREWLDLDFCAYARDNLVPEMRAFIRNGKVVCYHPRLEGFKNHESHRETAEQFIESGWCPPEREEYETEPKPTGVKEYAQRVADAFDGCWSVDFVMDRNGDWYCTDMALDALYDLSERGKDGWSNISEHPGDCEHDWENKIQN
jgi:hypothetical protein